MTQEERELLFKDLCARLPYGVCVHVRYKEGNPCYGKLAPRDIQWFIDSNIEVIKPYLRPMSSMTEDEIKELSEIDVKRGIFSSRHLTWHLDGEVIDYLNKKMLDWRGLILSGLALEAPKGMYEKKKA